MTKHIRHLPLTAAAAALATPVDLFICSASYEDRCQSIASALMPGAAIRAPIVCYNQKGAPQVFHNLERLERTFRGSASRVGLDIGDPLRTADNLQAALSRTVQEGKAQHYVVDITTFTHEALLILLRILQRQITERDLVHLVYTTAAEYAVGLKPEEKWLTKGVLDVRSVLGYPGSMRPSRKSHLIVLVGFEGERATELIESYEPTVISLGFGGESTQTSAGHHAINRMAFSTVASKVKAYYEFAFSTVDPFGVETTILQQMAREPDCNVVIAPMNTKLSTVGVAGVAFRNDQVRICYASAVQYNVDGYSRPSDDCYVITVPHGFWAGQN